MKQLSLLVLMVMAAPALADTAPPASSPPSVTVNKGAKTDFTKPFIDDRVQRVRLPNPPQDHPTVELTAGPGAK